MRILLLNPNTTESVTDRLHQVASEAAAPGTTLIPLTAPRGVPYIATRAEAQIGGVVALEMLAEHHRSCDAAIIAAFGEPGLLGARELFDVPIVGMAEAAMLSACMLGRGFAIVTFATALVPWFEDCVEMHGLAGRCAGVRMLDAPFRSIDDVQEEKEAVLVDLCNRTIVSTSADAIVLGGAPLAGLARKVRERIPVPVVDQVQAAVKLAEALITLRPRKATAGTFRRPAPKQPKGLAPKLAARIAHTD
jgi:Asp/Glu/hydantoin racemase